MLTKWFGTRTPARTSKAGFVHPQLEVLEDRLPPSSVHGGGNGNDNGNNNHVNIHNNTHIQTVNSFNGSFNGSVTGAALSGQNLGLAMFPQSELQGVLSALYAQAAMINPAAANALVIDEATLAIDVFMAAQGLPVPTNAITNLQTNIATQEATLDANGGVTGVLLGQVAFIDVLEGVAGSSL